MRIISPLLKRVVYPSLARSGFFRRTAAEGLCVVTYHGLLPEGYESIDAVFDGNLVSAEVFRRQLRLLKAHYNVISPEEMLQWCEHRRELPPRAVLLTCDDGLLNTLTDMLPVLQDQELRCLFFVTGASADEIPVRLWYEELWLMFFNARAGSFRVSSEGIEINGSLEGRAQRHALWWKSVRQLSQLDGESRAGFLHVVRSNLGLSEAWDSAYTGRLAARRRFCLLTRSQLQELASAGMTIGAHTLSHPLLSQLSPALAWTEIAEGRSRLEAALGRPVWALAYPFGDAESVTPQVLTMAREAGYEAAFLNFGGGLGTDLPLYAIPRVHVTAGMGLSELEAHVAGFYQSLQRRAGHYQHGRAVSAGSN